MKPIAPPLPPKQLDELLQATELLYSSPDKSENSSPYRVYFFQGNQHPELINEVGRLREITFRHSNSGTGKAIDLDQRDLNTKSTDKALPTYRQIVVYNTSKRQIVAGCRIFCPILEEPQYHYQKDLLATSELFDFSDKFIKNYLPYTMDIGRTFVIREYQSKLAKETQMHSPIEFIWKGFGQLHKKNDIRYFLGRVVIYEKPTSEIRNLLYSFLSTHFSDYSLMKPKKEIPTTQTQSNYLNLFSKANHYLDDYKKLSKISKERQKSISPLIRSYMNLSSTMRFFGSVFDEDLGGVEEMAIFITIKDIAKRKLSRFMEG